MARTYTLVSVVIPALNEEKFIKNCILSLVESSFPLDKMEILVIDGGSSDNTVAEVESIAADYPQVRLFHNPKRIVSAAMNLGALEAGGEILIRVDAHAVYHRDYITLSVENLLNTGAAGVGGLVTTEGINLFGRVIAAAVSTPLGTGGAAWRSGKTAGWVETIWCGCFWKNDFLKIGGFNEDWTHNQDSEFNLRLSQSVGKLYFDPRIRVTYFARSRVISFLKQYFRYGWWRAKTFAQHPGSLKMRHFLPVAFSLLLIGSLVLFPEFPMLLTGLITIYLGAIVVAIISNRLFKPESILVPPVLLVMHTTWSTGYLLALAFHPFSNSTKL